MKKYILIEKPDTIPKEGWRNCYLEGATLPIDPSAFVAGARRTVDPLVHFKGTLLFHENGGPAFALRSAKERTLVVGATHELEWATTLALTRDAAASYAVDEIWEALVLFGCAAFEAVVLDFASNMVPPSKVPHLIRVCRDLCQNSHNVIGRCLIGPTKDMLRGQPKVWPHVIPPPGVRWCAYYE